MSNCFFDAFFSYIGFHITITIHHFIQLSNRKIGIVIALDPEDRVILVL